MKDKTTGRKSANCEVYPIKMMCKQVIIDFTEVKKTVRQHDYKIKTTEENYNKSVKEHGASLHGQMID